MLIEAQSTEAIADLAMNADVHARKAHEEGREEERKAIAHKMFVMGSDVQAIANLTGLSVQAIEDLKKK